ncbi:MAG: ABC transporter permease [Gammaproteobacteria bacterium]
MDTRPVTPVARLGAAIVVVLGVTTLVFLLLHLVPGDPVEVMLGEYASAGDRAALSAALGLDRALAAQWSDFMAGLARGDLGVSLASGRPVATLLAEHFAMTALLAAASLIVAMACGLPLGVLAALRAGRAWDTASTVLAVLAMSVPNFVLGPFLMLVFAVGLGWFPVGGADSARALVLPAATLGLSLAALLARMTRAALLEELGRPYVLAARARGLGEVRVVLGHALPNAALPLVTTLGLQFGTLLGGAVVTETVFGWPGLGQLAVESIHRRDYPVVQGAVLLIALSYVVVNTLTDLLCARLDPRLGGDR